jgi:hypothetical protein
MDSAEDRYATYQRTTELLRKLAADDFSLIARAPPLLYHNDLTASVRRFYWSEDLGYALWLRLYFESERAQSRLPCREIGAGHECGRRPAVAVTALAGIHEGQRLSGTGGDT